jgi:CheY-like chemotaxis protein
MKLQVLIVEDDPDYMDLLKRSLPDLFIDRGFKATLHEAPTFEAADGMIDDPSRRFDLILSDTFRGEHSKHDAAVLSMIAKYRAGRFCPLIVFSASARPPELIPQAFVMWADKADPDGIKQGVHQMLDTGIPQIARTLHDELDRLAGTYLWGFLDANWDRLVAGKHVEGDSLVRLIRRRAALQLAEISYTDTGPQHIEDISGHEVYVYPPLNEVHYSLGEVIRKKSDHDDIRVILTPHCYLVTQPGQACPRAEYIVTVKTVPIAQVIGTDLDKARKQGDAAKRLEMIRRWINPPPNVGKPAGRYWYLPQFLDVPDRYCDFLQVQSLAHQILVEEYEELAVLAPPFAESLQACYGNFHGAVGIPNVRPTSVSAGFLK